MLALVTSASKSAWSAVRLDTTGVLEAETKITKSVPLIFRRGSPTMPGESSMVPKLTSRTSRGIDVTSVHEFGDSGHDFTCDPFRELSV